MLVFFSLLFVVVGEPICNLIIHKWLDPVPIPIAHIRRTVHGQQILEDHLAAILVDHQLDQCVEHQYRTLHAFVEPVFVHVLEEGVMGAFGFFEQACVVVVSLFIYALNAVAAYF